MIQIVGTPGYPQAEEPYQGMVAGTSRSSELTQSPIEGNVSAYHSGRSDEHQQPRPVEAPEDQEAEKSARPSTLQKISSIFTASTHKQADFPRSELYEGVLSELQRRPEHNSQELDRHVSVYHHGHSDEQASSSAVAEIPAQESTPQVYTGPLSELSRHDIQEEPLHSLVSTYHSGRSDEQKPVAQAVKQPTTEETQAKASTIERITSIFKKTPAHDDFPSSEPYQGALYEQVKAREIGFEEMAQQIATYHSGRSDEQPRAPPPVHEEEQEQQPPAEGEKKVDAISRITSLFARKADDYPPQEPSYDGPLQTMTRRPDVQMQEISDLVSAYHLSGRSDEVKKVGVKIRFLAN